MPTEEPTPLRSVHPRSGWNGMETFRSFYLFHFLINYFIVDHLMSLLFKLTDHHNSNKRVVQIFPSCSPFSIYGNFFIWFAPSDVTLVDAERTASLYGAILTHYYGKNFESQTCNYFETEGVITDR